MVCPCKECKDRWVTDKDRCHSTCSKYEEWKEYTGSINHRRSSTKAHDNRVGEVLYGRKSKV